MSNRYKTLGGYANSLHTALGNEELRAFAPSIFAGTAHSRASGRYSFLPTSSVLDGMAGEGWLPVAVQEQLVRNESRHGFQKHMMRFAHRDELDKPSEHRAEIVLVNSHDCSSAYQIHAGLFRFVCANGLVICDESFNRTRIKHVGFKPEMVIEATLELAGQLPAIMDGIREMQALKLSDEERMIFAESAAIERFGDLEKAPVGPSLLLSPRRPEDAGRDVWRTLNVLQENCVKGGQSDRTRQKPDGNRMPKSRPLHGIDGSVALNKALHHMAVRMQELKKGN